MRACIYVKYMYKCVNICSGLKGTVLNMLPTVIKGIVYPKIKFLPLFTHSHVVPNLYQFLSCVEHKT